MQEYRVLLCFLPFLASVWFLGPFWNLFSKYSKKDHFQKMNFEKLYLSFNLVSLDLTKNNKCSRLSKLYFAHRKREKNVYYPIFLKKSFYY